MEGGATLAEAVERLQAEGISAQQVGELLGQSLIVPVLTAHPTEVRRKSMIDHKNRIAALMRLRDAGQDVTESGDRIDEAIYRQIALLWQTRPLRREKLVVADEIENARAYMEDVFLVALPKLYARWERDLGHRPPSFLRLGSWIGGDRDGNPFVNAQTLDTALSRGAATVLGHYLECVHHLGAEISISSELAHVPQAVLDLAESQRRHWPPAARTNPIAARCLASMRGWRDLCPILLAKRRRGRRGWQAHPIRPRTVSAATWSPLLQRWPPKAKARFPAAAHWGG
jgi:phosphoenolpyruvate carboxylase